MGNLSALLLLLLLLVCSSRFLLHEARPLHSSTSRENMVTAVKKGSGGGARGGSSGSSRGSSSPYGKAVPSITEGTAVPKTTGVSSHKQKHNAAHCGYNFSIAALLIISAFWLESLACLYCHKY